MELEEGLLRRGGGVDLVGLAVEELQVERLAQEVVLLLPAAQHGQVLLLQLLGLLAHLLDVQQLRRQRHQRFVAVAKKKNQRSVNGLARNKNKKQKQEGNWHGTHSS